MSTRCNIIIKEKNEEPLIIYHHFDGYPEGVGAELKNIVADKIESICGCTGNIKKYILSRILYDYSSQYEETDNIHGDIEYLYVLDIKDDGVLYKCYDVPIVTDYDIETLKNCELVETMFINYKHEDSDDYKYPTLDEGIAYVSTKDWMNMSLSEILTLFHDYMNTPI